MKAISLLQPWATLMAIGAKHVETRSWATSYRGPLLIHASKGWKRWQAEFANTHTCLSRLNAAGITSVRELPRGRILAVVTLIDCRPTQRVYSTLDRVELYFGDYTPGRIAWITSDPRLVTPRDWPGQRGLFEIDMDPLRACNDAPEHEEQA